MNTLPRQRPDSLHPFAGRAWRDLVRFAGEALAAGLFASLVLALATFIVSTSAGAAVPDARVGLLLDAPGGERLAAPLLATDVDIDVSGIVARTTVRQRFRNPTAEWAEGVYVFPLPESAAVDHLTMQIGERRIEGVIRERGEARAHYEQAKAEGRRASLLEQQRPNVFTSSVAHIAPGTDIEVVIEYQQAVKPDAGVYRLRFPMVVAPRYIPGTPVVVAAADAGLAVATDEVPDAHLVTPPVVHPAEGAINPIRIAIDLAPGVPLARLESTYHAIDVIESADGRHRIELDASSVPADRDFELVWAPEVGREPGAALFTEAVGGRTHALLMVTPPAVEAVTRSGPREVVFVIDTSGSMEGTSIVQARAALQLAIDRLAPGDRFNVVEFNTTARALFTAPLPVDRATLARARSFVDDLKARGGTEMRAALALALPPTRAPGFVRQVVFLTDGAVGNDTDLITFIRERIDDRRLFTIGIGSAPNTWFMTKAALLGRGTFTIIGDVREVGEKMGALFRKLESPVLTDVSVTWPGAVESYPSRVADLYAGEPIVVTAAAGQVGGDVLVRGSLGGRPWQAVLPLQPDGHEPGIAKLWARAKIEALHDRMHEGAAEAEVRPAVIEVALAHHLVTRYTSLVAVDTTPAAPVGTRLASGMLPTNLPSGMSFDAIFGAGPQTATPAGIELLAGVLVLCVGAALAWRGRNLARDTVGG